MALIVVILVMLSTLVFFYLKCSLMQSLTMLWSSVLAMIFAFSYYEMTAELFISRGYSLQWAQFGCFLVIFIIAFAIFRSVSEVLVGSKLDLGTGVKLSMVILCGFLNGIINSGVLLVAIGLLPQQGKLFYSRFDPEKPVAASRPKKPTLNADGFVSGLYSWISSGSLSSGESFGVLHADYLSQNHLNKLRIKDEIYSVCSNEALVLPKGKTKKPIRIWDIPNAGQLTVIRMGVVSKKIEDGGANNAAGQFILFPAQIRLVTKKSNSPELSNRPMAGTGTAIYPKGFIKEGRFVESPLEAVITPDPKKMIDKVSWMDVVFDMPQDETPVLLQFRQNAAVDLTAYKAVKTSPEVENALDSKPNEEKST